MRTKSDPHPVVEVDMNEIERILQRAETSPLTAEERELLRDIVLSYAHLTDLMKQRSVTIKRLQGMLFGGGSEKTEQVLAAADEATSEDPPASASEGAVDVATLATASDAQGSNCKGHGRKAATDYDGAETVEIPHECLKPGDACPKCERGRVYPLPEPKRLVRIAGHAPLTAVVYEVERLRCNLCGTCFTAKVPEEVGDAKYDATAVSMIALLKYGSGLPFNRLERLEGNLGVPLPASTQWDIVNSRADQFRPVHEELIRLAAQGEVLHNDDTGMRILEFMGRRQPVGEEGSDRTGIYTSGIVSVTSGRWKIALFFTGRRHAGERLADVLERRAEELGAPIQMCDALSRNLPKDFATLLANCLAHGRRKFVDVARNFPSECRTVLLALRRVYEVDARARELGLTPAERLLLHQAESAPAMSDLKDWLDGQIDQRKVEPNSCLGEAIEYMRDHWVALTLFLREPGAPLDNNLCERALKKAILHRKNALFYKTSHGAQVGDLYMSLIHTAELAGANVFDYLTQIQRHQAEVRKNPGAWLPWNYQATLRTLG